MSQEQLIDLTDFPESNYESIYDIEEQNKRDFIRFIEEQIMKKVDERFSELNNMILEQQIIIDKLTNENKLLEKKISDLELNTEEERDIILDSIYDIEKKLNIIEKNNNYELVKYSDDIFVHRNSEQISLYFQCSDSRVYMSKGVLYVHELTKLNNLNRINIIIKDCYGAERCPDFRMNVIDCITGWTNTSQALYYKPDRVYALYLTSKMYRDINKKGVVNNEPYDFDNYIDASLNILQICLLFNIKYINIKLIRSKTSTVYNNCYGYSDVIDTKIFKEVDINIDEIDKNLVEKETNNENFIRIKNYLKECGYNNA